MGKNCKKILHPWDLLPPPPPPGGDTGGYLKIDITKNADFA